MSIKKTIYPKTQRINEESYTIQLTEKLDGSNLCIFKLNGYVWVAQRNTILNIETELEENKGCLYKGLYEWLKEYINYFKEHLIEGSVLCGEWLGMGTLKYNIDEFDKRFYMFAKANINENYELYNLIYDHSLFIYPFDNQQIPYFIGKVPVITDLKVMPNKNMLDSIYEKYCNSVNNRNVEGIVINNNNNITKYVRMKSGKLVEYSSKDHKGE